MRKNIIHTTERLIIDQGYSDEEHSSSNEPKINSISLTKLIHLQKTSQDHSIPTYNLNNQQTNIERIAHNENPSNNQTSQSKRNYTKNQRIFLDLLFDDIDNASENIGQSTVNILGEILNYDISAFKYINIKSLHNLLKNKQLFANFLLAMKLRWWPGVSEAKKSIDKYWEEREFMTKWREGKKCQIKCKSTGIRFQIKLELQYVRDLRVNFVEKDQISPNLDSIIVINIEESKTKQRRGIKMRSKKHIKILQNNNKIIQAIEFPKLLDNWVTVHAPKIGEGNQIYSRLTYNLINWLYWQKNKYLYKMKRLYNFSIEESKLINFILRNEWLGRYLLPIYISNYIYYKYTHQKVKSLKDEGMNKGDNKLENYYKGRNRSPNPFQLPQKRFHKEEKEGWEHILNNVIQNGYLTH